MANVQKRTVEVPHVVIIGGGFGGLEAAKGLRRARVRITVVDRENHHLFQPLLYQVATAGLSPADISSPIRSLVRKHKNTTVLLAEAKSVDLDRRTVELDEGTLHYDYLVLAAGARTNYFGHDELASKVSPMKCMNDAIEVRRRLLLAFEEAERETDIERRRELMSFAVIGGGPTGVELAGAIAELSRHVLARDFRTIDPRLAKITLIEAGPRVLPTFDPGLAIRAVEQLGELGVQVITGASVVSTDEHGVALAGGGRIVAANVIWAAGVRPVPLVDTLGVERDGAGRVKVLPDLSIPGHPEAFAIGDLACVVQGERCLPGLAPVAQQEGRAVARGIVRTLRGEPRRAFHYLDKGVLATIGRARAVADIRGVRISGFIAWLTWVVVHIATLIGFRNRVIVMFTWIWSYLTYKQGARVITGVPHPIPHARRAAPALESGTLPTVASVVISEASLVRRSSAPSAA